MRGLLFRRTVKFKERKRRNAIETLIKRKNAGPANARRLTAIWRTKP
jgi:hypothetical protein